jgi:hypothetical protein
MSETLISHSNPPSNSYEPTPHTASQLLLTSLRSPIASLEELEGLLRQTLAALGPIPPTFIPARKIKTELSRNDVLHIIPTVQHVLLSAVLPIWFAPLRDAGLLPLAKELFCPSQTEIIPRKHEDAETGCRMATSALATLLSHLPTLTSKDPGPTALLDFSVSLVEDIATLYPAEIIHSALFSSGFGAETRTDARRTREWEDYVRSACSVPGKVANALQGRMDVNSREELEHGYALDIKRTSRRYLTR